MSKSEKLYPLRQDIIAQKIEHEGLEWIMLMDPTGYAEQTIFLSPQFFNILVSIDSEIPVSVIFQFDTESEKLEHIDQILEQIEIVNEMGYLLSDKFLKRKHETDYKYLELKDRPPVCSGNSYPSDIKELKLFLDEFFSLPEKKNFPGNASSILVPHIDFRLGQLSSEVYASGYHAISNRKPELFIILGTAHYANSANYMLTRKNFITPLGKTDTDNSAIDYLLKHCPDAFVIDDIAHKAEHSIELQVVLLQHYFAGHKFRILPILVGSMHDYIVKGTNPIHDTIHDAFLKTLQNYINQNKLEVAFIASVDFAHIGEKFDDFYDAKEKLEELEIEDAKLIKMIESADVDGFYNKIASDKDKWKICGTAPIYSLLKANGFKKGELMKYNIWYDQETKSAVSFAGMAFYDN
jgi:AmmeMemoRadiSam system protein B